MVRYPTPKSAEPVAWYEDDFFAGETAATVHEIGEGKVYYMGTVPEEAFYLNFLRDVADNSGIQFISDLPEGIQISTRVKGSTRYLFLMNLTRKQQTMLLDRGYRSLLDSKEISPALTMAPYAVEIVELP